MELQKEPLPSVPLQKGTFTLRSAEALKAVEESAETDCLLRQKGKELRGRETLFFYFIF